MEPEKEIRWVGSSYQDILKFPAESRNEAGFQLGKGRLDWNLITGNLLTTWVLAQKKFVFVMLLGIYRIMYVAKFEEAIYVLHCFQKKTEATTKQDKAIAEARYRAVIRKRKEDKNDY